MHRLISLLLIPLFVLGQALPHSHAGTGVEESSDHAMRPHVHIRGHAHVHGSSDHVHEHDHHHGVADQVETPSQAGRLISATDHDADAVYFAASTPSITRSVKALPVEALPVEVLVTNRVMALSPLPVDSATRSHTSDPPGRAATLPIYLLTASLRL